MTTARAEVNKLVKAEFDRLHMNHPSLDGHVKWGMASAFVRTLCEADSMIIKAQIALGDL